MKFFCFSFFNFLFSALYSQNTTFELNIQKVLQCKDSLFISYTVKNLSGTSQFIFFNEDIVSQTVFGVVELVYKKNVYIPLQDVSGDLNEYFISSKDLVLFKPNEIKSNNIALSLNKFGVKKNIAKFFKLAISLKLDILVKCLDCDIKKLDYSVYGETLIKLRNW